jgi:hypothetical protein
MDDTPFPRLERDSFLHRLLQTFRSFWSGNRNSGRDLLTNGKGRLFRQPPSKSRFTRTYFLQKPSLPFVTTTQLVSFSKPFIPVSAPDPALIVSVLPLRVNSITSPFADPSKVFGPSRLAISIVYFSPFFVTFRYVPSGPVQRPASESAFEPVPAVAGLAGGEATGDIAGLAEAAGAAVVDTGGLTCGAVHAEAATSDVPRIIQNPKSKIPNWAGLLIILMFICIGQSRLHKTE